jgi:L-Lysine epsilon oxidase N-terminal/L-lysine epsilon oxidase C-terminal domain
MLIVLNDGGAGMSDTVIVKAKIHPAIGVARVGNSETGSFIGPEVINPPPAGTKERRDDDGALKRQAALFRIYGYNKAGEVVGELTADTAAIEWQVELANLKAAWYQFQIALDIPEAATADPSLRRNKDEPDRTKLAILGGKHAISGRNAPPAAAPVAFMGKFYDQPVYLGELQTDEAGRLRVLGGRGKTGSVPGAPLTTFANNNGWHDDTADGPVTATVSIGGRSVPVDPAWVVVGPPNYAPDLKSACTMYDLLVDVFTDTGAIAPLADVSFTNGILPIFQRLAALQWVNAGYAVAFGYGGWIDLLTPAMIAKLSDNSEGNRAFRSQIAHSFRDYDRDGWSPDPWPWIYGDAMAIQPFAQTPRQNSRLAKNQLLCLQHWADGNFTPDYPPARPPAGKIEDVPLAEQPAMLDRAALEFCLADVFHPGCEITWPMRHATMYMSPFRIRHRQHEKIPPVGDALTPAEALAVDGPLFGQLAGWLTRWMAVPWHTDAASCRSQGDYDSTYDPYVPTFWPARVPNQVVSEDSYNVIVDTNSKPPERVAAFKARADWFLQTLEKPDQLRGMVERYGRMGLVIRREGVKGDPEIPEHIYVSDGRKPPAQLESLTAIVAGAPPHARQPDEVIERLGQFPPD